MVYMSIHVYSVWIPYRSHASYSVAFLSLRKCATI